MAQTLINQTSNNVTQFGGGTATTSGQGNISITSVSSANSLSPGATGADNVIAAFTIPANSFSAAGKGIVITAAGSFASNNNSKTVKIIFNPSTAVVGSTVGSGGTTVCTTGALTTAANNVGWLLSGQVYKFGAANSNTQYAQAINQAWGTTNGGVSTPAFPTATENAAILVAVTGNAATTATDILLNFFEVNMTN